MNFLETIAQEKQAEVARRLRTAPVERLRETEMYGSPRRSLEAALRRNGFGVIAEVKRASPSRGILCREFDPLRIGVRYERGGASGVSVLTDERFFGGRLEYLSELRLSVGLPLLRKDFIVDGYQLHEARSAGADAVLLIVTLLGRRKLEGLFAEAEELGLEALVEVHNEEELRIAVEAGARLIGVNNRDLRTLRTSLETSLRLGPVVPRDRVVISESGITSVDDLVTLTRAGYAGALLGEVLMTWEDPGEALRAMLEAYEGRVA